MPDLSEARESMEVLFLRGGIAFFNSRDDGVTFENLHHCCFKLRQILILRR